MGIVDGPAAGTRRVSTCADISLLSSDNWIRRDVRKSAVVQVRRMSFAR